MVLQPFSIPEQIPKIKSGSKTQTTRSGIRNIPLGTKLQQYYRPRMKRGTCTNCIVDCGNKIHYVGYAGCPEWNNFFGEVPVTEINILESGLQGLNKLEFEGWAVCDGFLNGEYAEEWFINQYGIGWRQMPVTVIKWDNSKRVLR